jgi:hypothetical protein
MGGKLWDGISRMEDFESYRYARLAYVRTAASAEDVIVMSSPSFYLHAHPA